MIHSYNQCNRKDCFNRLQNTLNPHQEHKRKYKKLLKKHKYD